MSLEAESVQDFKITAYAACYVICMVLIGLAFHNAEISNIGSWLAGTLTPALLLAAIYSFRTAEITRREQAEAQRTIAQITERSTFISHRETFEKHLSYLGSCLLKRERMAMNKHCELIHSSAGGFERLWFVLARSVYGGATLQELSEIEDIRSHEDGFFLEEFENGLVDVLRLARDSGLFFMVDRRLRELPELLSKRNLWVLDASSIDVALQRLLRVA